MSCYCALVCLHSSRFSSCVIVCIFVVCRAVVAVRAVAGGTVAGVIARTFARIEHGTRCRATEPMAKSIYATRIRTEAILYIARSYCPVHNPARLCNAYMIYIIQRDF